MFTPWFSSAFDKRKPIWSINFQIVHSVSSICMWMLIRKCKLHSQLLTGARSKRNRSLKCLNSLFLRYLCKEYGLGCGEDSTGPRHQCPSVTHCICTAQKTFIYQIFAFPFPLELPNTLLRSPNHYSQHHVLSSAEHGI